MKWISEYYLEYRRIVRLLAFACGLIILAGMVLLMFYRLLPFDQERIAEVERDCATELLDCEGGLLAWRVDAHDNWRVPVKLQDISPWVIKSIVAAEDQRFWEHSGIDPYALVRAVEQNIRHGCRVSGASTISMQTMRLLRPAKRDWVAKICEASRALKCETLWDKDKILELYLNLAPYGGNVIGIEAAARHYFNKSARELTLGEAALLSGIPQSPARFNPRRHLEHALKRREYVFKRLEETGMASRAEIVAATKERIHIQQVKANNRVPRFADYVIQLCKDKGGIVQTTIDPRLQSVTESVVMQRYPELTQANIDGLAVVVINVRDSKVQAMIGNANPNNPVFGWVNGATAKRQPGSLLKPFIYCSAYERGMLTPDAVVYDVPSIWREYHPENIDHDYLGAISAKEALRSSRNIPAVRILEQLGIEYFAGKLSKIGLQTEGAVGDYSLSLALGTAEMSLLNLVNAYATLARGGEYLPLRVTTEIGSNQSVQVFTPQAVWLTIESLPGDQARTLIWKTGTSWNNRDAWAICISPQYVVGVWCGNFSGRGNNRLVGAKAALPIALELADAIKPKEKMLWHRPQGVGTRSVCALSGAIPGINCKHVVKAQYIPGVSFEAVCRLHTTETEVASKQVKINWPTEVAASMAQGHCAYPATSKSSLKILSPIAEATYLLFDSKTEHESRLDLTSLATGSAKIAYFIDGEYVGSEASGRAVAWRMIPGYHTLVAATEKTSVHTTFVVREVLE